MLHSSVGSGNEDAVGAVVTDFGAGSFWKAKNLVGDTALYM
jgi:hypothetical protein